MRRVATAIALAGPLLGAAPAGAQVGLVPDAPLRVGVAWSRGTPRGEFAGTVDPAQGFVASLSLPVTRRAALGIRGEFTILTLREQVVAVPFTSEGGTLPIDVAVRGTLAFTGAGPRIALGLGPLQVDVAAMAGLVRGINDLSARIAAADLAISDAVSVSDFTVGVKAVLDGYLPVYRGARGTSIGLTGGLDWFTGGPLGFARRSSLAFDERAGLTLERVVTHSTMVVLRAGLGAAF